MVVGMMLSGVAAGIAGVSWAVFAGLSLPLILLLYPVVGIMGALAFLALALVLPCAHDERRVIAALQEAN
ncbi:MAG: hypothetical protein U1D35_05565 [Paracoccaceae bacterium]|nr:hypothetical protein [Paracoccaceae bacterium]